jgi:hypothetical protein
VKEQGHDSLGKPTEGLISLVRVLRLRQPPRTLQKAKSLSGYFATSGQGRQARSLRQASFFPSSARCVQLTRGWLTRRRTAALQPALNMACFWPAGTRRQVHCNAVCLAPCASCTESPVKRQVLYCRVCAAAARLQLTWPVFSPVTNSGRRKTAMSTEQRKTSSPAES